MFKSRAVRRMFQIGLVLVLLIVLVGYPLVSLLAYNLLSTVATKAAIVNPTGPFENVKFPARGQAYDVYAFYLPGDPARPAIINVHGWRGSRFDPSNVERAEKFRALGYTVLSIDLSDSRGETVGNGRIAMGYEERYDLLGAFDYLISRGFTPDRIGVTGQSMGAATSLLAAALEPRIRAVWADSPFARPDVVSGEQAESFGYPRFIVPGGFIVGMLITGKRIWEDAPIEQGQKLTANKTTIQLVHCNEDDFVFYHHSQDILAAYQAANTEVDLWTLVCKKHASGLEAHESEYLARFDAFFKAHLGS